MTALQQHVQEYLQLRQALGHKLAYAARYLPSFVAYLDAQELARSPRRPPWLGLKRHPAVQPHHELNTTASP